MKIFNKEELLEREILISSLCFEIYKSEPIEYDWSDNIKFWIVLTNEDENWYDGGDLVYFLQNDLSDDFDEELEGVFTYTGDMNEEELYNMFIKIGFEA